MALTKSIKLHHSVTELGNIQVRQVVEYIGDDSKGKGKKHGKPYTPKDPKVMDGFDDRSKEIVVAIIAPKVMADLFLEKLAGIQPGDPHEEVTYDRVVESDGKIAVRRITRIYDEGVEVSKKYHRSWIMPGDDYNNADVISNALAAKLHTPEVISAYKAAMSIIKTEIGKFPLILAVMIPPQIVAITFLLCKLLS